MKNLPINIYSIPYSMLSDSKLVIYGAGKIGEIYIRKIKASNRCEIVAVVDSNYKKIDKIYEYEVKSPDVVSEIAFDYVLVAIEKYELYLEISKNLISKGVDEKKIFWNGCEDEEKMKPVQEYVKFLERNTMSNKRRFFIFMVPEHGNGGDYLISQSEEKFFSFFFPDAEVYTVTTSEWAFSRDYIIGLIKPTDVIFLNGGGYIGDLWPDTKNYKSIVEAFPLNKIFFFPNTLTYNSFEIEEYIQFMDEMEWFKQQTNTYVFFRDERSYIYFKKYNGRCELYPDMALINHMPRKNITTNNHVLVCMRDDREKKEDLKDVIINQLNIINMRYEEIDIHAGRYISQEYGDVFVRELIDKIQNANVLITDRLHGMIMAVISDVPCIAFDNFTKKVSGVYKWIKKYVYFVENKEDIDMEKMIRKAIDKKKDADEYEPLMEEYINLAKYIKQRI